MQGQTIEFFAFECKGCSLNIPKKERKDLEKLIAEDKNVEDAATKIKDFFRTAMGDRFILNCENCVGRRTYIYPTPVRRTSKSRPAVFGTLGFTARGIDEPIFTFNDYTNTLQDTAVIFDSLAIDLSALTYRNDHVLGTFSVKYTYRGKTFIRPLGYDEKSKSVILKYKNLFGSVMTRDITDTLPIKVFYININGDEVIVKDNFSFYFVTPEEKNDLTELYRFYRQKFPSWSSKTVTDEIMFVMKEQYKNVNKSNLTAWINSMDMRF